MFNFQSRELCLLKIPLPLFQPHHQVTEREKKESGSEKMKGECWGLHGLGREGGREGKTEGRGGGDI
jgi:hypothetical protein